MASSGPPPSTPEMEMQARGRKMASRMGKAFLPAFYVLCVLCSMILNHRAEWAGHFLLPFFVLVFGPIFAFAWLADPSAGPWRILLPLLLGGSLASALVGLIVKKWWFLVPASAALFLLVVGGLWLYGVYCFSVYQGPHFFL